MRVVVRVEVFLQNMQRSVKAILLLFGSKITIKSNITCLEIYTSVKSVSFPYRKGIHTPGAHNQFILSGLYILCVTSSLVNTAVCRVVRL